jgi:hypothetical protein
MKRPRTAGPDTQEAARAVSGVNKSVLNHSHETARIRLGLHGRHPVGVAALEEYLWKRNARCQTKNKDPYARRG